ALVCSLGQAPWPRLESLAESLPMFLPFALRNPSVIPSPALRPPSAHLPRPNAPAAGKPMEGCPRSGRSARLPVRDALRQGWSTRCRAAGHRRAPRRARLRRGKEDVVVSWLPDGNTLRALREQRAMTQAQLAQRAGVAERTVQDIEKGRTTE